MMFLNQLAAGAAFVLFSCVAFADVTPPDELVKNTATEVLELVKKDKDIQAGDNQKIVALTEEKIVPHFNFERMSRIVLGKHWKQADKAQQEKFTAEFRNLLVRTYSVALAKYRKQTIEYKPLKAAPEDTEVVVKTLILQPGTDPVQLDYALEKTENGWKVYDVKVAGVSLVTNYRGDFANQIKQGGIEGLLKALADKNQQMLSKKSS
jgi:phospholipid transport system substrate-binding protein